MAEESQDQLFHATLYEHLLDRGLDEQLLALRTPHLRTFLSSEPLTLQKCELLWQYYVKISDHSAAAFALAGLAQSEEFGLTLFQRVEYLSLAVSNAKSAGSARATDEDFISAMIEMEEKLEVAQVQVELYRSISELTELDKEDREALLADLDNRLLDISALYRGFAEPYNLYDIKIRIFDVSDHQDPDLVRDTWQALLDSVHDKAAGPQQHEQVATAIIDLSRRFLPSEVACPVGEYLATGPQRTAC